MKVTDVATTGVSRYPFSYPRTELLTAGSRTREIDGDNQCRWTTQSYSHVNQKSNHHSTLPHREARCFLSTDLERLSRTIGQTLHHDWENCHLNELIYSFNSYSCAQDRNEWPPRLTIASEHWLKSNENPRVTRVLHGREKEHLKGTTKYKMDHDITHSFIPYSLTFAYSLVWFVSSPRNLRTRMYFLSCFTF